MDVTVEDIRQALLRGETLPSLREVLDGMFAELPFDQLATPSGCLVNLMYRPLQDLVSLWMAGHSPAEEGRWEGDLRLVPTIPYGRRLARYMEEVVGEVNPDAVAIDASPLLDLGAANIHAFSLYNAVGLPLTVYTSFSSEHVGEAKRFLSGSALETLAVKCWRDRIPLIPIGMPFKPLPSISEGIFRKEMEEVYQTFDDHFERIRERETLDSWIERLTEVMADSRSLMRTRVREELEEEGKYLASRVTDLLPVIRQVKPEATLLVVVDLKVYGELRPHIRSLKRGGALPPKFYRPPRREKSSIIYTPCPEGLSSLWRYAQDHGPSDTLAQRVFREQLDRWVAQKRERELDPEELDRLVVRLVDTARRHPLVAQGPGVRAAIALKEVAQGFGLLRGRLTPSLIGRASHLVLPHRLCLVPEADKDPEGVITEVNQEVLYDIGYSYAQKEREIDSTRRFLTREETERVMEGLVDVALTQAKEGEAFSLVDQEVAQKIMSHPSVQEVMDKLSPSPARERFRDLLEGLEEKGLMRDAIAGRGTFTNKGMEEIRRLSQRMVHEGGWEEDEVQEGLQKLREAAPLLPVKRHEVPQKELATLLEDFIDLQHQGRSQSATLEDLYVHYMVSQRKGLPVSPDLLDYDRLRIMVHQLQEGGLLKGDAEGFTLTPKALTWLLEELIPKKDRDVLVHRAFLREHDVEKGEVRPYRKGDTFRDIAVRHTLKTLITIRKPLVEVTYKDLRSFERELVSRLDICLCLDMSASMKQEAKLRLAKMAMVSLAKAALAKHDRVGIVAFSNEAEVVVRLTDQIREVLHGLIGLRAHQYTNLGDGIKAARTLLTKQRNTHKKYIIIISDGQPNAATPGGIPQGVDEKRAREMIGAQHALREARKARERDIKISFLLITAREETGTALAKQVARIGRGRFYRVTATKEMIAEALGAL